jgi:hypothetical protein
LLWKEKARPERKNAIGFVLKWFWQLSNSFFILLIGFQAALNHLSSFKEWITNEF